MPRMKRVLMLKPSGEIWVKAPRTRRRFIQQLRHNVRAALARAGLEGNPGPGLSRLPLETPEPARARELLSRVFGLHSVAEAVVFYHQGLEDIVSTAAPLFRERVAGRTFAVRSKREGHHAFTSLDVNVALGSALLGTSAGVDLDHPEVEVTMEIEAERAFAVLEATPGPGGLPLGVSGRAVALFSGGFDSPVAAWMVMSRGATLDLVLCDLGGCAQTEAALRVARELVTRWAPGLEPAIHVVDLRAVVLALTRGTRPELRQVLLKRAMYRVGESVARRVHACALVTGDAVGQASSQTLQNLRVAEAAIDLPVLRPIVGMNKEEIQARARRLGTYESSGKVREYCALTRGRVETRARLSTIARAEHELPASLLEEAVALKETIDLTAWQPGGIPPWLVEEIPDGTVVIDVREHGEGGRGRGLRLPFSRAAAWMYGLRPDRRYVFVCSVGLRSETLAQQLRMDGYDAYCLAGGIARLG